MSDTIRNSGGPTRPHCAFCINRNRGLCQAVSMGDEGGSRALEASHSQIRVYGAGETIYGQGDLSNGIFNLVSGWIALHRDMIDGRRQITRFLLPGAVFGIAPPDIDLGHTATAITDATVCPMPAGKFGALRGENPAMNERFIHTLERDSHRAVEALTTLGQGNAKERVACLLAELAATILGEGLIPPRAVIRIPLTQRHIGEATGLTAIHVNRVLRQLREDMVLELQNGALVIEDPAKLYALTERGVDGSSGRQGFPATRSAFIRPVHHGVFPAARARSKTASSDRNP